jgi:tetratricopeptide (TPR) repeat protein
MSVKKASLAERRSGHPLELFERAVKALGKKDYDKAHGLLTELVEGHPEERDLLDGARAYLALCERALEKRPTFRPKTFEDLLNYGVFLHNRGDYEGALKSLHHAAEIHPKNEHVLYCIAAASARAGDAEGALKALRSAIHANAASRMQARGDSDFDSLRDHDGFQALVQPPASS